MINFKAELNAQQYKVVTQGDGACLVLAGAGSGKTRTITYRVAYLLEKGVPEENIMLLTFTNKAANEMLSRVEALAGRKLKKLTGGTFHKVALGILRRRASLIGFVPNFSILDSEDSVDLMKLAMEEAGLSGAGKKMPSGRMAQAMVSFAANSDRALPEIIEERFSRWEQLSEEIVRAAERYRERKKMAHVMDFDDLLFFWRAILQNNERVRRTLSNQFRYILVDEYQDTNKLQSEIVRQMSEAHGNVLAVGDDAQSIYSFRAADINNILDFQRIYKNARVFKLEVNYRSTKPILELANTIIAHNKKQFKKKLRTLEREGGAPLLLHAPTPEDEGAAVAGQIAEALHEGIVAREVAVLFRAAHHSQMLEMELAKRGIRYDYRGGLRFFERSHIKDVLAFLRARHNPHDEIAWRRVLVRYPGIGPATADVIYKLIAAGGRDRGETVLPARAHEGFTLFDRDWRAFEQVGEEPSALIAHLQEGPYRRILEETYDEPEMRLKDINQMRIFAERSQKDLGKFLAEASLQESYAADMERDRSHDEKIVLSTIHQAKGLEWHTVFVIHLVDGEFPNERAQKEEGGLEEERRLFYVAATRAKERLYLSYPVMGGYSVNQPSPFLREAGQAVKEAKMARRGVSGMESVVREATLSRGLESGGKGEVQYEAEEGGQGSDEPFVTSSTRGKKGRAGLLRAVEEL